MSSAVRRLSLSIKVTLYHAPYVQNPISVVCTTPERGEANSRITSVFQSASSDL